MERTTLYENDLTEERSATPVEREEQAHMTRMDPDVENLDEEDDEEADELDDEDEDEDLN